MNLALKRSTRMAWNAVMRFGCCLCICGILLGAAAVPRAKAVATEAAVVGFSPAILALYMKSAGLSLTATSSAAGAAAMTEMIGGYAAATGTTASAVSGSIAAGAAISTSGAIILGVAAVALLAGITAWAISEYGLIGEDGTPVTDPVPIVPGVGGKFMYNGVELPAPPEYDTSAYPYAIIYQPNTGSAVFMVSSVQYVAGSSFSHIYLSKSGNIQMFTLSENGWGSGDVESFGTSILVNSSTSSVIWTNVPIQQVYYSNVYLEASEPVPVEDWEKPDVSVTVDEEYEAPIEIPETKQMVIDVGAGTDATEDTITNLVFNNIVDGTLDPTYEVEDVDPGTEDPEPEPDPGDDPGSGTEDLPDPESLGLADLGEALTTRFPFSIPWDLYRAVKLLVAPAEAPYFEIDFLQPIAYRLPEGWQGSTTIVFDMAEYELIGQVSRWTSTVGFCLALIAGSKRYIWMS